MKSFGNYLNIKDRESKTHLKILKQLLTKAGFSVLNRIDDPEESYLFVYKPSEVFDKLKKLSFEGVRIYNRGKMICFRCQMKPDTEPFGAAYEIDVDGMYKELLGKSDKIIPYQIIFYIIKELKDFFLQSFEAEKEEDIPKDGLGSIVLGGPSLAPDWSMQNVDSRR